MLAALPRSGKRERTPPSSVRAVRRRAQCSGTSPHLLAAAERQPSRLPRNHGAPLAPPSRRICSSGRRCFSLHVRERAGQRLARMRAPPAYRRPALRRGPAGRDLLRLALPWPHRGSLPPVSRWGRRRHADRVLHVSALAGPRRLVPGPRGPGGQGPRRPPPARSCGPLTSLRDHPPPASLALARPGTCSPASANRLRPPAAPPRPRGRPHRPTPRWPQAPRWRQAAPPPLRGPAAARRRGPAPGQAQV